MMDTYCECGCEQKLVPKRYWRNCKVLPIYILGHYIKIHNPMSGKRGITPWNKGKTHNDKTRLLLSEKSRLSYFNLSEEKKKEISHNRSLRMRGHKLSTETKLKIGESNLGKTRSEETRKNISSNHANVGGKNNPMFGKDRSGDKGPMFGRHHSLETRIKQSKAKKGKYKGTNNPNWRGGLSRLPYPFGFDNTLKTKIKTRDSYICQLCRCSNPLNLLVHHIDYNKTNIDENNLVTLCCSCNNKVNWNREYWTKYFRDIVRLKCAVLL